MLTNNLNSTIFPKRCREHHEALFRGWVGQAGCIFSVLKSIYNMILFQFFDFPILYIKTSLCYGRQTIPDGGRGVSGGRLTINFF